MHRKNTKVRGLNNLDILRKFRESQAYRPQKQRKPKMKFAQVNPTFTLTNVIACLRSLNKTQVIGLCFMFLITSANAIEASTAVNKQKIYNKVCTNKRMATFNKPNITISSNRGKIAPKACIIKDDVACKRDSILLNEYKPSKQQSFHLQTARDNVDDYYEKWTRSVIPKILKMMFNLTMQQCNIFNDIITFVKEFKMSHLSAREAKRIQGGNCGEHTNAAMIAMFKYKHRYGIKMKIQRVTMYLSKSSRDIVDHVYLLLDSNVDNVEIYNDTARVKEVLGKISEGTICDPWNHGYMQDFKTDDSGFYNANSDWDNLWIRTFTLNFADFKTLPQEAQYFICQQFSEMGLNLEPQDQCGMFANPEKQVDVKYPKLEL